MFSEADQKKWVFITGGTGLLGKQFVLDFLEAGWGVVFTSRTMESSTELLKEFTADSILAIAVDLLDEDALLKIQIELERNHIHPNVLVNNARSLDNLCYSNDGIISTKKWVNSFLLDVVAAYKLSVGFSKRYLGVLNSIINISSMYGIVAPNLQLYNSELESPINYGVTKAALIHLTKELAVRLASQGVRVNSVSFGGVEGRADDDFKSRYSKLCPMGKMLKLEEVSAPLLYLASDKSGSITGHNLVVDGGWTVW